MLELPGTGSCVVLSVQVAPPYHGRVALAVQVAPAQPKILFFIKIVIANNILQVDPIISWQKTVRPCWKEPLLKSQVSQAALEVIGGKGD